MSEENKKYVPYTTEQKKEYAKQFTPNEIKSYRKGHGEYRQAQFLFHLRQSEKGRNGNAARRTAQTGGKEIDERQVKTLRPGSGRARSLPFSFRGSLWKKSII